MQRIDSIDAEMVRPGVVGADLDRRTSPMVANASRYSARG
jgi:hypothetical protein